MLLKNNLWIGGNMTVPNMYEFMLPLLIFAREKDGRFAYKWAKNFICNELDLPKSIQYETYLRGNNIFDTRLGWAAHYLYKAKLLKRIYDGVYSITERGLNVLEENPKKIDREYLMRFREFREYMGQERKREDNNINQSSLTDF